MNYVKFRENELPCRQYQQLRNLLELSRHRFGVKMYFKAGRDLPFNPEIRENDLLAVVPGMIPGEKSMILLRHQGGFRILYYHRELEDEYLVTREGEVVVRDCAVGDSLQILGTVTSVIHQEESGEEPENHQISLNLPPWLAELEVECETREFETPEEQLRLAFCLAERNVLYGTGGPFGAAVFSADTGRIVSLAVNSVVALQQSSAHAEMMAIAKAHKRLGRLVLKGCVLVSSCEPCAMCTGALLWSGIGSLVYGAPGEAARSIGFDEGDKVPDWQEALAKRGVQVQGPLLESEAREALQLYRKKGGRIY